MRVLIDKVSVFNAGGPRFEVLERMSIFILLFSSLIEHLLHVRDDRTCIRGDRAYTGDDRTCKRLVLV